MDSVAAPDDADPGPPFDDERAALAWLRAHGIEHVARWSLGALAPHVPAPLLAQIRSVNSRHRLIDLVAADALDGWVWSPAAAEALLPRAAARVLDEERDGAAQARATLAARLEPPEDPRTHPVHRLLLALRARIPAAVAPRPLRLLAPTALQLDRARPGFRLQETRVSELPMSGGHGGFVFPDARLTFTPAAVTAECSCGAKTCVHVLTTIDTVLMWLRHPWSDDLGEVLDELVRPGWERTLRALDAALVESTGGVEDVEIWWRLQVHEGGAVEVAPWVHRRTKKGRSAGARFTRRKLLQMHGAQLSAHDARVAALLPDGDALATRAVLLELIDHPRVVLDGALDREARVLIERAKVGLVAEDRGGVVIVTAGVDGAALPAAMAERARKARPDDALCHWERGARRLTVLDVAPDVRALLGALHKHGNAFPPESLGPLIEKLSTLSARVPVALPRSVMGEAVAPLDLAVVRLEAEPGGEVRLELRTRPLEDSPTFAPGEGPRDVHVRRGTSAVHAVRDRPRERARAEALAAQLPLADATPLGMPFGYQLPSAEAGLAVLAACATIDPPPALEWIGVPLRILSSGGPGALRVVLEQKRAWFGVLGDLAVEGERVELARLLDAARRRERFVRISATTFVEIEEALREHLQGLSDHVHAGRHGLEIGASAAEAIAMLELAGAEVTADASWRALADRIAQARTITPAVPPGLGAALRDYQRAGFTWMSRLASWQAGGILADDMGLGKTVQALAVLLDRRALGPQLVLAPTSVAWNWIDEAARFAPDLRLTLFGDADDRALALERLGPGDVLVLTYGLLTRDATRLAAVRFATIVFDEAQTLKNARTQRVRAARTLQGDFKIALSGTPLENHLGELWSLLAVVFPGLLGSWEHFRTRFATPIEKGSDPAAAPALARVLAPFLLRRTKDQVEAELPPRTDVRVPVVLSSEEWTRYEDARLAALSDLESKAAVLRDQERRVEVLAALTRLRLLASHPRLQDASAGLHSSKLDRFLELVTELGAEGHRALVFSQFTSHLALVREALDARGIAYEYLDGQTPPGARADRVRAFQDGAAPLFLISLKAGGFGLNLTAATSVIHLDPWWNPAVEDQASDRAHRIGQTRPVTVYRLVARGTIEEQMLAMHERKRTLVAGVLAGKDQAERLSTDELIAMLSRRGPLVAPG
jgi:superfamily II DNA or RNA helicase